MKYLYTFVASLFLLFVSCDVKNQNSLSILIDKSENVNSVKICDDGRLIVYTTAKSGTLVLSSDERIEFNVSDKCTIEEKIGTNTKVITYIPIKPFVVLTYDDCPAQDYDVFPIHKKYNAPAEIAINLRGHALSTEKIIEMVSECDFEVTNHSFSHSRMECVSLQKKHLANTNKIYGWFAHTFQDGIEITIDGDLYKIESHSSDSDGQFFTVSPNLIKDYNKGTRVQLSDNALVDEINKDVKKFFDDTGIEITNFTYPYTVYDERTINIISEYYKSSRAYNGYIGEIKNLENPGMNYFPFENRFNLNSASFTNYYDENEISEMLIKAKNTNALIIQFTHTWDSNFSKEKLEYMIKEAKRLNIDIATRQKIWSYYEIF